MFGDQLVRKMMGEKMGKLRGVVERGGSLVSMARICWVVSFG